MYFYCFMNGIFHSPFTTLETLLNIGGLFSYEWKMLHKAKSNTSVKKSIFMYEISISFVLKIVLLYAFLCYIAHYS